MKMEGPAQAGQLWLREGRTRRTEANRANMVFNTKGRPCRLPREPVVPTEAQPAWALVPTPTPPPPLLLAPHLLPPPRSPLCPSTTAGPRTHRPCWHLCSELERRGHSQQGRRGGRGHPLQSATSAPQGPHWNRHLFLLSLTGWFRGRPGCEHLGRPLTAPIRSFPECGHLVLV